MSTLPERLETLSNIAREDAKAHRRRIEQQEKALGYILQDLDQQKLALESKYGLEPRATRIEIPDAVDPTKPRLVPS